MFKVGEKMVCLATLKHPYYEYTLVRNEVYTCAGYSVILKGQVLIFEMPCDHPEKYCCAREKLFRKLDYDFVESVIEKIKEEELTVKI